MEKETFDFSAEDTHAGDTSVILNTCPGRKCCWLSTTRDEYGSWMDETEDSRADPSAEHGESDMMWFTHIPKLSWLCNVSLTEGSKESTPPRETGSFLCSFGFTWLSTVWRLTPSEKL